MTRVGIVLFFLGALCSSLKGDLTEQNRPNVLFIVVDDLNDWVGCLDGHPNAKTPHIDRLASEGVLFSNAHCQSPICNPSRTSFLFGTRPSSNGFYGNSPTPAESPSFREEFVSLPRHFRRNGYKTFTTGKLYHASQLPEDDFEVVGPRPGQWIELDKEVQVDRPDHMHWLWDFGPQSYDETKFSDYVDASWIIEQLEEDHDRPFFMSIGFYRPHVPFFSPERIYNQPEFSGELQLPPVKADDRDDISAYAQKLIYSPHPASHGWMEAKNNLKWQEALRAYLACVHWTDEQLGRVLNALQNSAHADNTLIVFFADHGFHLGEKRHWAKWTLWERSTRVPLIIRDPKGLCGVVSDRPVELLGIYPTLVEMCGLEENPKLEGQSLVPLLEDPEADWPHPAITTLYEGNHSVRTARWRYIHYANGDEELYDHWVDPHEWTNLASHPDYEGQLESLSALLPKTNRPQVAK